MTSGHRGRDRPTPSAHYRSLRNADSPVKVTGVDIYFGPGYIDEDEDDEDENDDDDGVQEFIKKRWNLNARFRDDRSNTRITAERFHLVNSRLLMDGINTTRWPDYINDLKLVLKPGGWLQMVELEFRVQSDNGRIPPDDSDPLYRWYRLYLEEMERMGKDPRIGQRLARLMRDKGFENVTTHAHRLQIGRWNEGRPSDTLANQASRSLNSSLVSASLGMDIRANLQRHIAAVSLWAFLRPTRPPMAPATYQALVGPAVDELQDDSLKLYYTLLVTSEPTLSQPWLTSLGTSLLVADPEAVGNG